MCKHLHHLFFIALHQVVVNLSLFTLQKPTRIVFQATASEQQSFVDDDSLGVFSTKKW